MDVRRGGEKKKKKRAECLSILFRHVDPTASPDVEVHKCSLAAQWQNEETRLKRRRARGDEGVRLTPPDDPLPHIHTKGPGSSFFGFF